ncbi:phosphopantetheine-binding protein [Streptomyces sp. NPDC051211]|uniref:phosphopantetheine-binding protein n=1 Tax=Streptomyces sp. NPDC051211 TaxID=3154643 RepID=UPI00344F6881
MTSEQHAAPAVPPETMLADLVGVLGDVLRVQRDKIDPDQTFPVLGLDSLLTLEFIAVVNARYGVRARATDLFDHPTPALFARQVALELAEAAPAPRAAAVEASVDGITEELHKRLAALLCRDIRSIDPRSAFTELGLNPLHAAEFMALINRTFGVRLPAESLRDHPTPAALAAAIAERTADRPRGLDSVLDAVRS